MSLSELAVWTSFVVIGKSVSHLTPMQTSKRGQMIHALQVPTDDKGQLRWRHLMSGEMTPTLTGQTTGKMQNRKLDKEQHRQTA